MFRKIFFYSLLHVAAFSFSQEKVEDEKQRLIEDVVKSKNKDYFSLDSILYRSRKKEERFNEDDYYKLYEKSIRNKYVIGQIFAANNLGICFRRKSNYDQSAKYHKEALKLARTIKDVGVEVLSLNMLGVSYRRQGDMRNAINYHQASLSKAKQIKNPTIDNRRSIGIAQNSIGNIYLVLRQYSLALIEFEKAIQIQKELQDKRGLAINYQNTGFAQENLMLLDEAEENYKKSLALDEEINSTIGKIVCYNSLSSIYIKKKNYEKALKNIEKILPAAISYDNKYYLGRTYNTMGEVLLKLARYDESKKFLNDALAISREAGHKKNEIRSLYLISEFYDRTKDVEQAYAFYRKASIAEKRTQDDQSISYVSNLISKHNMQSKINELNYLESQSKIKTLLFFRNRNILIISLITIALLSIALYSIYRQRLINNDRKILLLEQQALQTQMNPHFLFNALNSIKLYIINNDQKQAVYYLNKFSKLIRNILDVSKVKEVSLKEELSTMDLYMSIENIRFSNEIDYKLNVDSDLNTDTIKVPPLILQPFIENAIWHGLSSKEGSKTIALNASKISKDIVEINIEDDGIGREAAGKIKKAKSLKRKSVGIDLTIERLKTFAEDYEGEFNLSYHDLTNDEGTPIGTRVSLKIPLV